MCLLRLGLDAPFADRLAQSGIRGDESGELFRQAVAGPFEKALPVTPNLIWGDSFAA